MSAFLVSPMQIGKIVKYRNSVGGGQLGYNQVARQIMRYDTEQVVDLLVKENIKSLQERYPDSWFSFFFSPDEAEDKETIKEKIQAYIAEATAYAMTPSTDKPIDMIGYIKCYRYQSCEHDGWIDSDAYWITQNLLNEIYADLLQSETWEAA